MENHEVPNFQPIARLNEETRAAFYRKTYTHLAGAVLLFILIETLFFQIDPIVNFALSLTQGWTWLLLLGGFMFITNYAEGLALKSKEQTTQYLALLLYVAAEAFIFIPLIFIAINIYCH